MQNRIDFDVIVKRVIGMLQSYLNEEGYHLNIQQLTDQQFFS